MKSDKKKELEYKYGGNIKSFNKTTRFREVFGQKTSEEKNKKNKKLTVN